MSDLLYVLPKPNYFKEGGRGRVTHAVGVVKGLAGNGLKLKVLSGEGAESYIQLSGVEVESVTGGLGGGLARLKWDKKLVRRIRHILTIDPSIRYVVVRYSVSNSFIFVHLMKEFENITWVFEVNSLLYHRLGGLPNIIKNTVIYLEKSILNYADLLYLVSCPLRDDIVFRGNVEGSKVVVVPNGGDSPPLWKDIRPNSEEGTVRFVYAGVLQPYYDLNTVTDAFSEVERRYDGVELHIHGDGPQEEAIRRRSDGINNIYIHGRYTGMSELLGRGHIRDDDVLILPYGSQSRRLLSPSALYKIGSPIKLYEYMSLGLPIIASRIGQIRDVLKHRTSAMFYELGDSKSLFRQMVRLLKDPSLRNDLKDEIRSRYVNVTWDKRMADLWRAIKSGSM